MKVKKIMSQLHLWLGLASGLVVFIVAITGAIWTFESEISDVLYDYRVVQPQSKPYLPPSQLKSLATPHLKGFPIKGIDYAGKDRAAILSSWGTKNGEEFHIHAYLNPYTGEMLHVESGHSFFDIIIELHVNLMMGEIGGHIVDFATLFFVILLITGMVLWWPKNKAAAKQRFWFKWKEGLQWKRKNYDLHNILGFYSSFIIIFVAITGLAWGFEWVNKGIYYTATLGVPYKDWADPKSPSDSNSVALANVEDIILQRTIASYGKPYASVSIYTPDTKAGVLAAYIYPSANIYHNSSSFYYDQRTGKPILEEHFAQMNNGEKIRSMYYDIHVGKILGLTGQLLVFFASLITASLPITGFYIWWGRRKHGQQKKYKNYEGKKERLRLIHETDKMAKTPTN
jgi:uncharacterized iron-regulated membrane protein